MTEGYVEFVSARWSALFRLAYLLTGSRADAEDVLQQALLRAYRAWRSVERADSPEAYVRRIVVNTAATEGRRRGRLRTVGLDAAPEPAVGADQTSLERDDLWPRVQALPPRQRAIVVLRYYEDLSEREIADVLDCAPGTVKSQAHAALRSLRVSFSSDQTDARGGAR